MTIWKKLTLATEPGDIYVNLSNTFGMMRVGGEKTRIWSGDVSSTQVPKVKSADQGFSVLPFYAEVRETPEEILGVLLADEDGRRN